MIKVLLLLVWVLTSPSEKTRETFSTACFTEVASMTGEAQRNMNALVLRLSKEKEPSFYLSVRVLLSLPDVCLTDLAVKTLW